MVSRIASEYCCCFCSENLTEDYFVNKALCIESSQKMFLLKDKATVLDPKAAAMILKY